MTEKSSVDLDIKKQWFLDNYNDIINRIGENDVVLLAATKTVEVDLINFAIENGIKYIGENRVQEFLAKKDELVDCHRHFIGHLQKNKVKDIVPCVEMIHSVHSVQLAYEIGKQCVALNKTMDILLEVNIGEEKSKSGFLVEDTLNAVVEISNIDGVRIKGLMAIPPICQNAQENEPYFEKMQKLFIDIGSKKIDNGSMVYLSMGMSDDFDVAIKYGANIIRIGTALFGKREYK